MSMSWTGKIKAALQGEVDGADVLARLAATAPLERLRQPIADRRLEVEIANTGEEWRVPVAMAPVVAPLWLADSLVTLARSLTDAEAAAHPDRPAALSALTHGQALLLLEPMDALQAEIGGMLADPDRRSTLALPLLARPYAHSDAGLMAEHIPVPYLRGLLDGVARLGGAVALAAQEYGALPRHPTAPAWLSNGFATLVGDVAAAQSRLDAVQGRATPLLQRQTGDEAALRNLAIDLWHLANTYLKLGQLIMAPTLLPGAQPVPPRAQPVAPPPPRPPAAPAVAAPVAGIPPGAASPARSQPASPPAPPPMPASVAPPPAGAPSTAAPAQAQRTTPESLPGVQPSPPRSQPASPPAPPSTPSSVAPPAAGTPPAAAPAQAQRTTPEPPPSPSMPVIDRPAPAPAPDSGRPRELPQIGGPERAAPPVAPGGGSGFVRQDARAASDAGSPAAPAQQTATGGRHVDRKDRWMLSARSARHRLRTAGREDQAERALTAFWEAKGWALTAQEERYLDEVAALVARGAVAPSGRSMDQCPFAPIYKVTRGAVQVDGHALRPGALFSYEHQVGGRGVLADLPAQAGVPD